jgi:hypothetical protein
LNRDGERRIVVADSDVLDEVLAGFGEQPDVVRGKMFGKHCLVADGKVIAVLFEGDVVFKLPAEAHAEALQLAGAHLWDPRGTGHPMREWVQVPAAHSCTYGRFARAAYEYVVSSTDG